MSSDNDGFSNLEIAAYGVLVAAIVVIAIVLLVSTINHGTGDPA
jgi:prolipoprotein diacylglyceryltransferase